jgi:hypothetical protein
MGKLMPAGEEFTADRTGKNETAEFVMKYPIAACGATKREPRISLMGTDGMSGNRITNHKVSFVLFAV